MAYYSCYMAPIKKTAIPDYRKTSLETAAIFKSLGALEVVELMADATPQMGIATIAETLHCEADETVILGWTVWPSKEALDACNAELQTNGRKIQSNAAVDFSRLVFGNFRSLE